MEKEAAGRGGGINLVGQGFEVYATLFSRLDGLFLL